MGLIQESLKLGRCDGKAPWLLVTNARIPCLSKAQCVTTTPGLYIYGNGVILPASKNQVLSRNGERQALPEWATDMDVNGDTVRLKTGVMNNPPLYITRNTTTRAWAIGTDVFTLNATRYQWEMPIKIINPTIINRDSTTSFVGVTQLPAHAYVEIQNPGSGWQFSMQELYDPLFAVLHPRIRDFTQAGSRFVEALQAGVSANVQDETEIATLLSGGIDSGAVTTFAVRSGVKVTAYSAGSPWGNEHEEAQELADFLGIPLVRIELSTDEILAAIPASMRALGTANRVQVDVSLIVSAVMRSGIIKERHILTGYGADPLLLGLPPDCHEEEVLTQSIISEADGARHSCEFTDAVARTWNKRVSHPFWHSDVIKTAVDIHPHCKVHDGREKAFFRAAMERYMPKSAVWRYKIGIHLGGGLQGGLDMHFGGVDQKTKAYTEIFESITETLLEDPFANIDGLHLKVCKKYVKQPV
ncbi:hypothetical protein JX266_012952 [Neoarthrinium moseri]|nr:hypothetical protein JX266_012952 [Neoarthrinium moseri]